jgi:hypothetical protein
VIAQAAGEDELLRADLARVQALCKGGGNEYVVDEAVLAAHMQRRELTLENVQTLRAVHSA